MLGLSRDIGVDLGTATVLVYIKGKGIVLHEPSVVALDSHTNRVLAVGQEASMMIGRTPGNIRAVRPLKEGVIADFDVTELMLKHFLAKVCRNIFAKPRVMVCVPAGITSVEQRAVLTAVKRSGAREVYLIEEPRAAALGAGLEIFQPVGSMVIDIGGGTCDVAIMSLGDIVQSASTRIGGDRFDEHIIRYVRDKYNIMIGERTAEEIKVKVASVHPQGRKEKMEVRGRDLVTGLPKSLPITSKEAGEALTDPVNSIVRTIIQVLEATPPELHSDIMDKGIVLSGGGSLLHGLDVYLSHRLGAPVIIAENPISCVVNGTGRALELLDYIKETLINDKMIS
ncbi:MAG: rod shape-determining protein MreB [Eubacteriales bacterium]|nr:rod shape-determining protein MreB [Eubacteriales bacterium]MDD3072921.1 rod shape-determining protein MreB [Eubacteriales bacterium]MDD4078142.1 rod shape-determining protein MreB [Eubacteriales bacterium]MDD4768429.1 rod shape-determining protein MreB [Eubacteriales bacterium]